MQSAGAGQLSFLSSACPILRSLPISRTERSLKVLVYKAPD
jgi:hypothetical protein